MSMSPDQLARQQGFPDYATMAAYMARQSAGYHQNNGAVVSGGVADGAPMQGGQPQGLSINQRFQNWLNGVWKQ